MKRILVGATLIVAGIIGVAGASPVSADNDNPAVCDGTHITPPANTTEVTVTAPEGKLISGYCVKSGSINQDLGPEYVTLAEPVPTVTITYTKTTDVKDISHYVVTYVDVVVPEEATPVTPVMPTLATPPSCEAEGVVEVLADTEAYTYDYVTADGVTTVTVTAKAGHVLVGDFGPWTFPIAQLTGEGCETQVESNPPPATPATPVAPPETPVAPVAPTADPTAGPVGGSATPADPSVASAGPVPAQATPTALPATGTSSWVLAFVAMALVLLGSGFVSFSRRLS